MLKYRDAQRHVRMLVESGRLFPGERQLALAALMVLGNHMPTNWRDWPDAERDWLRLSDALRVTPEQFLER